MKQIIQKLKDGIAEAINLNEDLDDASWGNQHGILITANEANAVFEALKALKNSSNSMLADEVCDHSWRTQSGITSCSKCHKSKYDYPLL